MKKGHHLFQIVSFFDLSLLASVNKVSILNAFKGLLYRHTPSASSLFLSPKQGGIGEDRWLSTPIFFLGPQKDYARRRVPEATAA